MTISKMAAQLDMKLCFKK